ncbi:cysteine-rich DPF motif domain-containing protein 1 [Cochliomyia hominivorax]
MSPDDVKPSCSKNQNTSVHNDETSELYIKNEQAEIDILEKDNSKKLSDIDTKLETETQDDERIAKIKFRCSSCDMEEMVHYFGIEPTFVFGIKFNEPTYIMRDPFQAPPPRWKPKAEYFVALGAHCKLCNCVICKDNDCSFFYINTYCLDCAKKTAPKFPLDIQQKLRKQLAMM